MIPAPLHLRQGQPVPVHLQKGADQWEIIAAPDLDHALVPHRKIGDILDSGCLLIDFWQGEKLVTSWKITFHESTSHCVV